MERDEHSHRLQVGLQGSLPTNACGSLALYQALPLPPPLLLLLLLLHRGLMPVRTLPLLCQVPGARG